MYTPGIRDSVRRSTCALWHNHSLYIYIFISYVYIISYIHTFISYIYMYICMMYARGFLKKHMCSLASSLSPTDSYTQISFGMRTHKYIYLYMYLYVMYIFICHMYMFICHIYIYIHMYDVYTRNSRFRWKKLMCSLESSLSPTDSYTHISFDIYTYLF